MSDILPKFFLNKLRRTVNHENVREAFKEVAGGTLQGDSSKALRRTPQVEFADRRFIEIICPTNYNSTYTNRLFSEIKSYSANQSKL